MGLFSPAWQSKNEQKALKAIESLSGPELAQAASAAPHEKVRLAAAQKIQRFLFDAVTTYSDEQYTDVDLKKRMDALSKLTDPAMIDAVVQKDLNPKIYDSIRNSVRIAAMEKTSKKAILKQVAGNKDEDYTVRCAAAVQVAEQALLLSLFRESTQGYNNEKAKFKLLDRLAELSSQNQAVDANIAFDILTFIQERYKSNFSSGFEEKEFAVKTYVLPFINAESLTKILEAEFQNRFDWDYLRYLQEHVSNEVAWQSCENIKLPELSAYSKVEIYKLFHYVDGDLFKTPCEAGGHQWDKTGSRSEGPDQDDSDRRTRLFYQYKCSVCGTEKEELQGLY